MTAAAWYRSDFGEWANLMLEKDPLWYTRMVEQFVGPEGGEFCDYVGTTENIVDDFQQVLFLLGYVEEGQHMQRMKDKLEKIAPANVSKAPRPVWPDGLQDRVLESERSIIERFYQDNTQRIML